MRGVTQVELTRDSAKLWLCEAMRRKYPAQVWGAEIPANLRGKPVLVFLAPVQRPAQFCSAQYAWESVEKPGTFFCEHQLDVD